MKKTRRILGRKLATELTAAKLEAIQGGREEAASVDTWTTSNPPDKDPVKSEGPIWV